VTKIEIFEIQDVGDLHLENRFFDHNSSTDCPISAKFCVMKQNSTLTKVAVSAPKLISNAVSVRFRLWL